MRERPRRNLGSRSSHPGWRNAATRRFFRIDAKYWPVGDSNPDPSAPAPGALPPHYGWSCVYFTKETLLGALAAASFRAPPRPFLHLLTHNLASLWRHPCRPPVMASGDQLSAGPLLWAAGLVGAFGLGHSSMLALGVTPPSPSVWGRGGKSGASGGLSTAPVPLCPSCV